MSNIAREPTRKPVEVFLPFRQYERRSAIRHSFEHVIADALIAGVIIDEFVIERVGTRVVCPRRSVSLAEMMLDAR